MESIPQFPLVYKYVLPENSPDRLAFCAILIPFGGAYFHKTAAEFAHTVNKMIAVSAQRQALFVDILRGFLFRRDILDIFINGAKIIRVAQVL